MLNYCSCHYRLRHWAVLAPRVVDRGIPGGGTRLSKPSRDKQYHAAQMAIAGTNPDRAKATHGEYQTTRYQHSQVVVAKPLHNPEDLRPQTESRSRIV